MKNLYIKSTLLSTLLFSTGSYTQQVLEYWNFDPQIGISYQADYVNWDGNPGNSGANVTWDFTNLVTTQNYIYDHVPPSEAPNYNDLIHTATIAQEVSSQVTYDLFLHTNSSFSRVGIHSPGTSIIYTSPHVFLEFPVEYGNTFTSPIEAEYDNLTRQGTDSVEVDAYGTLQLPTVTLNNVLRVKHREVFVDTDNTSAQTTNFDGNLYYFYIADHHFPVLYLGEYYNDGSLLSRLGYYNNAPNLSILDFEQENTIELFPNPAVNKLSVKGINIKESSQYHYNIISIDGKKIASGILNEEIDVSSFQNGTYLISIKEGERVIFKDRFVKI